MSKLLFSILFGLAVLIVGCGTSGDFTVLRPANAQTFVEGNFEDLPVDDNDLLRLNQLLDAKWSYFLLEMDNYNLVRNANTNDAMVRKMEKVFASQFEFEALNPDGSTFGTTQGTYTPRSWLEAQNVTTWNLLQPTSTLLVPNYLHILYVEIPGQRVRTEGYHEHTFTGQDTRNAAGEARHMAKEKITWQRVNGVWRVVAYTETNFPASEIVIPDPPPGNIPSGHGPPRP